MASSTCYERLSSYIFDTIIPKLTGVDLDTGQLDSIMIPLRYGGLGILDPNSNPLSEYDSSLRMSQPLLDGLSGSDLEIRYAQIAREIRIYKQESIKTRLMRVKSKSATISACLDFAAFEKILTKRRTLLDRQVKRSNLKLI
ncbi:hypothetical protein GJ496_003553 [Pomphorhynchus laevis]|nr:hypothetical protein GJ496_003553 [Pomphorhynchus laevis]